MICGDEGYKGARDQSRDTPQCTCRRGRLAVDGVDVIDVIDVHAIHVVDVIDG